MSINKIEMQDDKGNTYYPHTDASIVKYGDSDVGSALSEITQYDKAIYKRTTDFGLMVATWTELIWDTKIMDTNFLVNQSSNTVITIKKVVCIL